MSFKFNPITASLDWTDSDDENYSYNYITAGEAKTIPVKQQMLTYAQIILDDDLTLDGDLVLIG